MGKKVYRVPNKKKWLIDKEFLEIFKRELDQGIDNIEMYQGVEWTYEGVYKQMVGSKAFHKALLKTSEERNVRRALFAYMQRLDEYSYEVFQQEIISMIYEEGLVN